MPFVCRQSKKLRNYWEFFRLNYLNYKLTLEESRLPDFHLLHNFPE
nr:MAG TPA: hypothetical protein [Caudoviricetes sp.]